MSNTNTKREVIVGVDGSTESRLALEWALDPQKGLGPVRTITSYTIGPLFDGMGLMPQAYNPEIFRDAAHERAKAVLQATDASLLDGHTTVMGAPGVVLVEASEGADLLVVGCRGRGALAEMFLGSVGSYCVKRAKVPVVVVPESGKTRGRLARLIVGVDGSDNSKKALRWALDNVAEDGQVVAMATFTMMIHAFNVQDPAEEELIQQMTDVVQNAVLDTATKEEIERFVEVDVHLGDPRLELARAGTNADALVIGARGHRGVAHLLLGSNTTALVHQPTCVTVVVPG